MIGYSPLGWYSISENLDGALNEPFLTARVFVGVTTSAEIAALPDFELAGSAILTPFASGSIISTTRTVDCSANISTELTVSIASTAALEANALVSITAESVFVNAARMQGSALVSIAVPNLSAAVGSMLQIAALVSPQCSGAITVPVSIAAAAGVSLLVSGHIAPIFSIGDGTVVAVLNTYTGGAAEYTDYRFNSFFRLGAFYYGCTSTGVVLLDGATPSGMYWEVVTPTTDFGSQAVKYVPGGVITLRTDGEIVLAELVDEQTERTNMRVPCDGRAGLHSRRVLMPKGVHGSAWRFAWSGLGVGADIKEFSVDPLYSKRTVR